MTNHKYGFLIDASKCIDCRACLISCSVENNVSMKHTRIWIKDTDIVGVYPDLKHYTAPFHCMHCTDPSCVSACTVGALQQSADGVVVYDDDRCIGCRYCMYACPFQVPHFEWDQQFALITKCDMCFSRLQQGRQPACSATCPSGAIQFGAREDMLARAHELIQSQPERYINHIFGEFENGGTSTFYVSPVPFEQLGFPTTDRTVSPAEANRAATEIGTPVIAGTVALGMTGIYLALEHKSGERGDSQDEQAEAEPAGTKKE